MKRIILLLQILLIASLLLSACQAEPTEMPVPTSQPTEAQIVQPTEKEEVAASEEDVLYLNLVWHQHQPLYYKDDNGVYTRPWVRVHATKDYFDMAAVVSEYPDVHVTFNLTPVLIKQIDDFAQNGAKDLYWEYALVPADQLTTEQKEFILTRFFDANWDNIIARFPRYQELLDQRGGSDEEAIQNALESFSDQDFLDLQIWFNLAWFDPDFLAEEPLASLVEQQRDFSEGDKEILFEEALRIMQDVIPLHRTMQESGQIEVITTPYAHPILPLLIDTNLANVGNPGAETPPQFSYPQDALVHLEKSVEIYQDHYGVEPRGLWPGEGSVAQVMVPFVIKAGYQWMATGEPVLAKSLGIDSFTRDSTETVNEADLLYRPYYVKNKDGEKLAVFFRDGVLSDKLGFTYSGVSGTAAASDLMMRLENIRTRLVEEGAEGPHIVSIILDGENAWEYYENDGKDFFHAFYQLLSDSETIESITPSNYLEKFPEQREIDDLFAGAWFSPNYDTWIGESEENQAWDYLGRTRDLLAKYDVSRVRQAPAEQIALAQDYMYLAEGSDWFWWYGADQDSGQDSYFDEGFRALLRKVHETLGEPVPTYVNIPIIQARPVPADVPVNGLSSPTIDGFVNEDEWVNAGEYLPGDSSSITSLQYTTDAKNIYLKLNAEDLTLLERVGVYFRSPRTLDVNPFTMPVGYEEPALLGSAFSHLVLWDMDEGMKGFTATEEGWVEADTDASGASGSSEIELAVPFAFFGELETGDEIRFLVDVLPIEERLPAGGPGQVIVPDLGLSTTVFEVMDPEGDDHGPGTYTYPTDAVFQSKVYDLKSFEVAYDETNVIFKIEFYGAIPNPWGSPNNLAIQTLDIYIDTDPGGASGVRELLPGRNISLDPEYGWEYAVWAEGWTPQILTPDPDTLEPKQLTEANFKILVDPAGRMVTIRIPKTVFDEGDPATWAYAVVVAGQEGYPSTGVWRIRDVEAQSTQWRFGGAPTDANHTRVIDLIWPAEAAPSQEEMLSDYPSSNLSADELSAEDYATIGMLEP